MRFGKKVLVVAIMGIMVAMAAEHEAHAGCIGHGASAGYDRDAVTGPGVRTVYIDELPGAWTPESFITLDDGGCIIMSGNSPSLEESMSSKMSASTVTFL